MCLYVRIDSMHCPVECPPPRCSRPRAPTRRRRSGVPPAAQRSVTADRGGRLGGTFRAGNLARPAHHHASLHGGAAAAAIARDARDRLQLGWREIFASARRHRAVSVPR